MPPKKTSLQLLLNNSTPLPFTPSTETTELLRSYSSTLLNLPTHRNFSHPVLVDNISPNMTSIFDGGNESIIVTGRKKIFAILEQMFALMPDYHSEILDSGGEVDEKMGRACIWVLRMLSGFPDGLRRESVSVLDWESRGGEWICVRHRGLRNVPWRDFEDAEVDGEGGTVGSGRPVALLNPAGVDGTCCNR